MDLATSASGSAGADGTRSTDDAEIQERQTEQHTEATMEKGKTMRINIYAEELTNRVEVISKSPDNHPNESFKGVRMYLASPDVLHADPDDDDSSAITIWVPWTKKGGHRPDTVTRLLRDMANQLEAAFPHSDNNHDVGL